MLHISMTTQCSSRMYYCRTIYPRKNLTISFYVAHIYIPPCNFNSLHFCLSRHSFGTQKRRNEINIHGWHFNIHYPSIHTYKFYVITCWNEICAIKHLFHDIHWKLLGLDTWQVSRMCWNFHSFKGWWILSGTMWKKF